MIATAVFVLIAVLLAAGFAFLGTRRSKSLPEFGAANAGLHALDIEAFRNLVDPEEEAFLRSHLPAQEFRKIKRERARAALAYVKELSGASLQFARLGDAAKRSTDPVIAASGRQIANSAISLRLRALEANVRLVWSAAFPGFDSRPLRSLLDRYDQVSSLLQEHNGLQRARSQAS
jgi:hypothetical protein